MIKTRSAHEAKSISISTQVDIEVNNIHAILQEKNIDLKENRQKDTKSFH